MKKLLFLLGLVTSCFAIEGKPSPPPPTPRDDCPGPWFTGPLLAPAGHVIPQGYINVEPYTFYSVVTGIYNADWKVVNLPNFTSVQFEFLLYLGLTDWADILIAPEAIWNETQGVSSLEFGDLDVVLDIQLYSDSSNPAIPALKFYVQESFPTGHYQKRDPERLLTDIGGNGSFETTLGFVTTSTFEPWYCHFLNFRLNGFATFRTDVDIKGISAFGGSFDTDGTITLGFQWGGIFALQYNFTQNWAFAMDIQGIYTNPTTFKGFEGTFTPDSPTDNVLGFPTRITFSIAPALEYNFNASFGIIAGSWFTFAGKSTPKFYSGVIAINYYGPISGKKKKSSYRDIGGGGGN